MKKRKTSKQKDRSSPKPELKNEMTIDSLRVRYKDYPTKLTAKQTAEIVGCTQSNIRAMCTRGHIPEAKKMKGPLGVEYWEIPKSAAFKYATTKRVGGFPRGQTRPKRRRRRKAKS